MGKKRNFIIATQRQFRSTERFVGFGPTGIQTVRTRRIGNSRNYMRDPGHVERIRADR
jgi:hypothetical protein